MGCTRFLVVSVLVFSSCSSVPDFKPSKPIEEASSFFEAIYLCSDYQILGERNQAGHALPARVAVLVPWLRCFETVFLKFPQAKESQNFVMFFRALQALHDRVQPPTALVIDWPTMNFVVRRVIEHIQNPEILISDEARRIIKQQLPDFALYLGEKQRWKISPSTKKSKVRLAPLSPKQKEYCKQYQRYWFQHQQLQELKDYNKVLEEQTHQHTSKSIVQDRIEMLSKEAHEAEKNLTKEFIALHNKSNWFSNDHCLHD